MMQTPPESVEAYNRRMAGKRFLGCLLMATGGMVALLCGLCTIWVGATMFSPGQGDLGAALLIPLVIGGVPAAGGVALFVVGLQMFREGQKRRNPSAVIFD